MPNSFLHCPCSDHMSISTWFSCLTPFFGVALVTHPAPRVGGCCLAYSPCNLLCIYRVPIVVGAVARSVIVLCRALPYHCRVVSPYHRCRCISPCIAVVSRRVVAVFTFRLVLPLYLAVLPPCMYYISPWGCPNPIPYHTRWYASCGT